METQLMFQNIGRYRHYTNCRFCFSKNIAPVINLGNVPLAGGFLKNVSQIQNEHLFPLEIFFCKDCYLVQSINVIDKSTLFEDYFYHSSAIKTLISHFEEFAKEVKIKLKNKKTPLVVEIGCNDGTLIKKLAELKINALGVDPAKNIVSPLIKSGMHLINDYFSEKLASNILQEYGKADIVCSFNVLAHIEDMHDIVKGIKKLLKSDGSLIFETHYLGNMIEETQYDMIYHEHQYYYSLVTLSKFFESYNMEIYNVTPVDIHAGSMRYYVQNKKSGGNKISKSVQSLLKSEKELELDTITPYVSFAKKIKQTKKDLLITLQKLKKENASIVGYGASGRGTIIMNYCRLDKNLLDFVVDDAPAKQGMITPGTHLNIFSSEKMNDLKKPIYAVLFAWSFINEVKLRNKQFIKNGGKFIVPLPMVSIVPEK